MTEDELIQKFFVTPNSSQDVTVGIGDDAAILNVPSDHQLITSVDTLLEGVHFPENISPENLASRAVAVCVSDIAAMGAVPKWMTLALSLPKIDSNWLENFSQTLHKECGFYGLQLIGGDTVKGTLAITINVMGIAKTNSALRRDSAQKGDLVYVSGTLGGAAYALSKIQSNELVDPELVQYFTQPKARVKLGQALVGIANSCMDVSDGVLIDAARLAKASKLGLHMHLDNLPIHQSLQSLEFEEALHFASSGDDYELLFTAAPKYKADILQLSQDLNLPLSVIGQVVDGEGVICYKNDRIVQFERSGYQHFQ